MTQRTPPSRRDVARLLGESAAAGDAFSLLGLTPAPAPRAQVESALQRQLDRLQQHAEGDSPAADQVRLVLHEAASTLLDPRAQARLIAQIQAARAAPSPAPAQARPRATEPLPARRERVGDPTVARALVIGLAVIVLMVLIVVAGSLFNAPPAAAPTAAPTPTPAPATADPAAPVEPSAAQQAQQHQPPAAPPVAADAPRSRSQFVDPAQVVRDLRAAAEAVRTDPDNALVQFERAFGVAGDWWCRFEPAQSRAAADAIAEFLYRAGQRREVAERALQVVEAPSRVLAADHSEPISADAVWPAAWSAGLLARFYRERDLPPAVATRVARAIDLALGDARPARSTDSTFDLGAAAAFNRLPRRMFAGARKALAEPVSPAETPLSRWIEGVTMWCKDDPAERERILTASLGWILTSAPEPQADARVFAAINLLAAEIKWRAGGAARPALIEWFNDSRVSAADLRVLTAALASRSSAEGVGPTMALPMTARAEDRAALRDQYAKAWGLAGALTRAESAREWAFAADQSLAFEPRPRDPAEILACVAAYARLTSAASILWRGGSPPSPIAWSPPADVESASRPAPANGSLLHLHLGLPNTGPSAATGSGQDGVWTQEYLSERNSIPGRIKRLDELSLRGRPIGPIDAGLLAQAALSESPWRIREHAQLVLRVFAEEPALVAAMLDFLPLAPRTSDVSRLYADVSGLPLPAAADPSWELEARRAILSRLMSMLTTTGLRGDIESSVADLASSYLATVDRELGQSLIGPEEIADGAAAAIAELADRFAHEARTSPVSHSTRFSLDAIERRRAQRRLQASGPVQAFAAEQAGLLELLAFVVASNRPVNEAAVASIIDDAASARRKAAHVFEQLLANERAMVRLWRLRISGSEAR
ncbi:MAG: hypothetical protein ACK4WH_08235 [Phycisphaerales bacterium]